MSRSRPKLLTLAAAFAVLALAAGFADARAEMFPNTRQGFYVGLGAGGGAAALKVSGFSSDREGGATGAFGVGYAFNDQVGLALDASSWTKSQDGATLTLSAGTVAVNFFPGAQGLVLRGGIGGGSADVTLKSGSRSYKATESGFGVLVGAGYDFRVLRTFALGPEVSYTWMTFDEFDADVLQLGLGVRWYFIPK